MSSRHVDLVEESDHDLSNYKKDPGTLRFGLRVFFCINFMISGLCLVPCRWLHPLIVIPSRSKNVVFEWFVASSILVWSSARVGYVDLISDGGGIQH